MTLYNDIMPYFNLSKGMFMIAIRVNCGLETSNDLENSPNVAATVSNNDKL